MVTLLVANYAWKFTVLGDEDGDWVSWFGMDISAPFVYLAHHVAVVVYWLISLVRDTAHLVGNTIRFDSGSGTTIVWGCSGLKQMFIWLCLILTVVPAVSNNQKDEQSAIGPCPINQKSPMCSLWLHKLWFIPFGWLCCYAFNILRIFLIALVVEHHPEWFAVLHGYVFKYMFYAMLFGLWVWFVEKIRP